jgi:hypothetical protein
MYQSHMNNSIQGGSMERVGLKTVGQKKALPEETKYYYIYIYIYIY